MIPTFIIGPPRSGTTLLKDILAQHPALTVHGEDFHRFHHALGQFPQRRAGEDHYRLTTTDAHARIVSEYRSAVRAACDAAHSERFVLKISTLSIQVDFIKAIFPEARFIQLVRDGRDAACSMEDLRRALAREERRARDLGPAPDPLSLWCAEQGLPPHVRAAAGWFYHVTRSWLDLQFAGAECFKRYRYEDLVRSPGAVVQDVLTFLGVDRCPQVDAALAAVADRPGKASLGFSTVQAQGARRMGRHADELSAAARAAVAPLLFQPMLMLGYAPDSPPSDLGSACADLGIDAEAWQRRMDAETQWFAQHAEAFSPAAMLRSIAKGDGGRPLLVDAAEVGSSAGVVDGKVFCPTGWVQKQSRRHTFADPRSEWPTVARQLDGRVRLADLSLSPELTRELYRLRELGFVALL